MTSIEEKAALDLSHSLINTSDYQELWQIYQTTINKFIPIDWLGLYTAPTGGEAFNVTSHPNLPFNWDELYQQIAPLDDYREHILTLPPGQPLIFEEMRDPKNETQRFCLEFAERYTDTVHMMGMATFKDEDGLSLLGLYRTDKRHAFTQEEKRLLMNLGPILSCTCKQLLLHQQWNLKRAAYEKLFESEDIRPAFLDHRLRIIDLPSPTQTFFAANV